MNMNLNSRDKKLQNVGSPIYREELALGEDSDEGADFEKTNQIFILNSKINELNILIQKISLEYEEKLMGERNAVEYIRNEYQKREDALSMEYHKVKTIAQAEKEAKGILSKQMRAFKNVLEEIRLILQINSEASSQNLKVELINRLNKSRQLEKSNSQLKEQLQQTRRASQQKEKRMVAELQTRHKKQQDIIRARVKQLQVAREKQAAESTRHLKTIEDSNKQIDALTEIETQYGKLLKTVQQLQSTCMKKQQELAALRVKEQIFAITKEKYQEGKLKMDEYSEEMTFKLGLERKKLEVESARLEEEKAKNTKLEHMLSSTRQQLRISEERVASLEQTLQQLQQKISISQVYRQKQRSSVSSIGELEEKNRKLTASMQLLARQRQEIEQQLHRSVQQNTVMEKSMRKKEIEIEELERDNMALSLKLEHQNEVIKEIKLELAQTKTQLEQLRKESNMKASTQLQVKPTVKEHIEYPQREIWQKMNEEIVSHYQKILESEDRIRLELQQQLQQAHKTVCELRHQLSEHSRDITELRQERELLLRENKRLGDSIGSMHKVHEQRVAEIRQKITDLRTAADNSKVSQCKSQKHMNISNCYNFCQQTETGSQLATHKAIISNQINNAELKVVDRSGESNGGQNVLRRLVKVSSSDNFTDNYRSTQVGYQERSGDLNASIKLFRERNSSMRVKLQL